VDSPPTAKPVVSQVLLENCCCELFVNWPKYPTKSWGLLLVVVQAIRELAAGRTDTEILVECELQTNMV